MAAARTRFAAGWWLHHGAHHRSVRPALPPLRCYGEIQREPPFGAVRRTRARRSRVAGIRRGAAPFPVHFTAGVRRSLGIDDNPNGIYNLGDKPVLVAIYEGSGVNRDDGLYVIVRQALIRSFANGTSLDDPQTAFLDMAISDDPQALGMNATVEITDEWTLEAGIHREPPATAPFTLFGAHVKASGVRAGASFQRLFDDDPETEYWKALVLVADLVIVLGSEGSGTGPGRRPSRQARFPLREHRPRSSSTTSATSSATPPSATSGRPTRRSSKPLARYDFRSTSSGL